jgi:hypothetical protein
LELRTQVLRAKDVAITLINIFMEEEEEEEEEVMVVVVVG